ncbi:flagellar hook assembly protein FlgD [Devosia sp.]|jgi:flagellar basal-body rod modification protein FlgD|uniref:flagellar hook assembly protein FlgD n=1 Tax=Devosia sp. TaxID=1871048 RepID=UPI0037BEA875
MAVSGVGSTGTTSTLTGSRQGIADNFDTFLSILTTQLKNQNPLDPLDTNQFTQQLVQFTGVEQQLKTNQFLEAMMLSTQNSGQSDAVNYIGKVINASGTKGELVNGAAAWNFALDEASTINVTVKDAKGNVVFTKEGKVAAGESVFNWDGVDNNGKLQPDGTYSIAISAKNADGKVINAKTDMVGEVTGVDFTGTEPVLLIGSARVNLSSVNAVKAKS